MPQGPAGLRERFPPVCLGIYVRRAVGQADVQNGRSETPSEVSDHKPQHVVHPLCKRRAGWESGAEIPASPGRPLLGARGAGEMKIAETRQNGPSDWLGKPKD